MRGLEHLQRWALLDRTTQRLIMRDSSISKLRRFGALLARCGVEVDYRREVAMNPTDRQVPQWTPGPWIASGAKVFTEEAQTRDGWQLVISGRAPGERGPSAVKLVANARLIAAAPDLYAALKWIIDLMPDKYHEPGIKAGRAALAKAEGRAP